MVDQGEMIDVLCHDCNKSFDYLHVTPINEQKRKKWPIEHSWLGYSNYIMSNIWIKLPDALCLRCQMYLYKHTYIHECIHIYPEYIYLEISDFWPLYCIGILYHIDLPKVLCPKHEGCAYYEWVHRNAGKISETPEYTF